jgi:hypothetical protein
MRRLCSVHDVWCTGGLILTVCTGGLILTVCTGGLILTVVHWWTDTDCGALVD